MGRVDTLRNDSFHVASRLRLKTDAQSAVWEEKGVGSLFLMAFCN